MFEAQAVPIWDNAGSPPRKEAAVAQWIEYWPPKPRVVGSIPASRTITVIRSADFHAPILWSGK
jgi:hypothetical protein